MKLSSPNIMNVATSPNIMNVATSSVKVEKVKYQIGKTSDIALHFGTNVIALNAEYFTIKDALTYTLD